MIKIKTVVAFFSAIAIICTDTARISVQQELPPFSEGLVPLTDTEGNEASPVAVLYYISTFEANAYTAYSYCLASGRHLLSIQTDTEQAELERFLDANQIMGSAWTSGTDVSQEATWLWGTGEQILHNNFAPGEAEFDHPSVNCLVIAGIHDCNNKFKWVKRPCSDSLSFICESIV